MVYSWLWKTVMFLIKLKIHTLFHPVIPILGIFSGEMKTCTQKLMKVQNNFIYNNNSNLGKTKYPSTGERINKLREWIPHLLAFRVGQAWGMFYTLFLSFSVGLITGYLHKILLISSSCTTFLSLLCHIYSFPCQHVLNHTQINHLHLDPCLRIWGSSAQVISSWVGVMIWFQSILYSITTPKGNLWLEFSSSFSNGVWLWSQ